MPNHVNGTIFSYIIILHQQYFTIIQIVLLQKRSVCFVNDIIAYWHKHLKYVTSSLFEYRQRCSFKGMKEDSVETAIKQNNSSNTRGYT